MLYTKNGDNGKTSNFEGDVFDKDASLIEALGTLDEVSSWVGLCQSKAKNFEEKILNFTLLTILSEVQNDFFEIQSLVAGKKTPKLKLRVEKIEKIIDFIEGELPDLKNFLKVGGSELALRLNYARVLMRKAERRVVALSKTEKLKKQNEILTYLNRLSDLFFVLYRFVNFKEGQKEDFF